MPSSDSRRREEGHTEVIGHAVYSQRHVRLGPFGGPQLAEVAFSSDEGESRAERRVEARGAYYGVYFEVLAVLELDAALGEPLDGVGFQLDLGIMEAFKVARRGRHARAAKWKIRDQLSAELLVALEHGGHEFADFAGRPLLLRRVLEKGDGELGVRVELEGCGELVVEDWVGLELGNLGG